MSGTKLKFWIGGALVSLAGIVLARVVAPAFTGKPALLIAIYLLGITLGLAGLVIITFGMPKIYLNAEAEPKAGKNDQRDKK